MMLSRKDVLLLCFAFFGCWRTEMTIIEGFTPMCKMAAFYSTRSRKMAGFLASRISQSTMRVTTSIAYESTPTSDIGSSINNGTFFTKPEVIAASSAALPLVQMDHDVVVSSRQQQEQEVYENFFGIPTIVPPSAAPDPSSVEIVPCTQTAVSSSTKEEEELVGGTEYPFAAMLQGSAPYIASHLGKVAVFHISGDLLIPEQHDEATDETSSPSQKGKTRKQYADALLSDIALTWLMGMKIVLVVSGRTPKKHHQHHHQTPSSSYPHEYYNSLKMLNADEILQINQDAGYVRFEVERKLNKCLNLAGGPSEDPYAPVAAGNVVSGNFYTAKHYGYIRGRIFQHTGFAQQIHTNQIRNVLDRQDVVLLTNVGTNIHGDMVYVNGNHLAASVAVALDAHKMIYVANEGAVLRSKPPQQEQLQQQQESPSSPLPYFKTLQDIPLSFAQEMIRYHGVDTDNKLPGYASFHRARKALDPRAVELLLHLGWSSWALERGVARAHVVNPKDGGLLEELFTSKNGENTCIYHDDEYEYQQEQLASNDSSQQQLLYDTEHDFFADEEEEWDDYIMSM